MEPRISLHRIEELHRSFAEIGTKVGDDEQQRSCSTKRLGYRAAESAAHEYLKQLFTDSPGIRLIVDPVGNTFVEIPGSDTELPPIVIGSHLDTVARPGLFDGVSGVVAAICIVEHLIENKIELRHPVRIVAWRCEESSRFGKAMLGSKWFAGQLSTAELLGLTDQSGLLLRDDMADLGLRPDRIENRAQSFDRKIAGYLELHIEQWDSLIRSNTPVGIVKGFKGTYRTTVSCGGKSVHSGTAIMRDRQDPTPAVARMIAEVEAAVLRRIENDGDDALVASTGFVSSDGSMNQTARNASFTLDVRDLNPTRLVETFETLSTFFQVRADSAGVSLSMEKPELVAPVETEARARQTLVEAAKHLGLEAPMLASGAGHDAVPLLMRGDEACMIFVRSNTRVPDGAFSHNWTELADYGDLAIGADLGLEWLLRFDKTEH